MMERSPAWVTALFLSTRQMAYSVTAVWRLTSDWLSFTMILMTTQEIILTLQGMSRGSCTEKIQQSLNCTYGVVNARVNYATERARVLYDPARTNVAKLVGAVRDCGCDVQLEHISIPLSAIGTLPISQTAIVDTRIDWHTRRVDVEWLDIEGAPSARPSLRTTLFLLSHLFRPRTSKNRS